MMSSNPPDATGPSTVPPHWVPDPSRPEAPVSPSGQSHPARKPQSRVLSTAAHVWLGKLPPRYQPLATARLHPHIVNRLCELWETPSDLPAHMRELLLSSRPGDREGFAFEVLTELADLQNLVDEMLQRKA